MTQIIEVNQTAESMPTQYNKGPAPKPKSYTGSHETYYEKELRRWFVKIEASCGSEIRNELEVLVK
jgi:hypothetical protein